MRSIGLASYAISFGGWLFPAVAFPAMLIAYFWMAFRNYKSLQIGWPLWAANFIRFIAVFVGALLVAGAVYARAWEYVMPLEPHHGPARLSGAGQAKMAEAWSDAYFYALLPDGRLWAGQTDRPRPDRAFSNLSGHFVGDSNWVDVAGSRSEGAVALKSDGTLWRFSRRAGSGQIGTDSDWKKMVAGHSYFLALKQNGTMWGWGWDESGILPAVPITNDRTNRNEISDPVQLWPDADWADVFASGGPRAVKRDGSFWTWGYDGKRVEGGITNYSVYHRLARMDLEGTNWSSLTGYFYLMMGVRTDGTLWLGAFSRLAVGFSANLFGSPIPRYIEKPTRFGSKSDWVGVSLSGDEFIALEADGTLWAINVFGFEIFQTKRPSRYHDWLAASGSVSGIWALAKDGTISCWRNPFLVVPDAYGGPFIEDHSHFFLFRPSRRPLASINILDAK
jgi:hypothetical protein